MRLKPATRRGDIGGMYDLERFERTGRVFLARLLTV